MVETSKRCSRCEAVYPAGHWAHKRLRCPACGALLEALPSGQDQPGYEHYDSSVDVRFDLSGLLGPEQHREARTVAVIGVSLILVAFLGRLLFSMLGSLQGFWSVPLWFDLLVLLMILFGVVALAWSIRRLLAHRRVMRRQG